MFLLPVPRYLFLYSDLAVLDIISSDIFLIHFFSLFSFWDSNNGNVGTQCYLRHSLNFFFIKKKSFSFFCSEQMISIVPSASFCMKFIPSSMFYLKFQILNYFFIFPCPIIPPSQLMSDFPFFFFYQTLQKL